MAETWPAELQQTWNADDFNLKLGDVTVRSNTDTGPGKVRARVTARTDTVDCSILVPQSLYSTWETFYQTTTGNGVRPFGFTHPIKNSPIVCRFIGPPSSTKGENQSGIVYRIIFSLQILPGGG